MEFKNKIKNILIKLFSKNIALPENKSSYSKNVEAIDDVELGEIFEKTVKEEIGKLDENLIREYLQYKGAIYNYPLKNKVSKEDSIELTRKFFEEFDEGFGKKCEEILNGKDPNIIINTPQYDGTREATVGMKNNRVQIIVPLRGDLRDIYNLIHEITHSFDAKNGDTTTKKILGEVAPQCMEREFDEFLIGLSNEDKELYGINDELLKEDIQNRKITTFISRYENVLEFNKNIRSKNIDGMSRMIDSRYMLAQIYQTQYLRFDPKMRRQKIIDFINCVEKDEFERANETLELKINRDNKLKRNLYVSNSVEEVTNVVLEKYKLENISKSKEELDDRKYLNRKELNNIEMTK